MTSSSLRERIARWKGRILEGPKGPTGSAAGSFWDSQTAAKSAVYWAAHPLVRAYVNTCITGVDWLWPLNALKVGWTYKALESGLSIGCGTGGLERSVIHLHICKRIEGIDVSRESVRIAKVEAKKEKLKGIRYSVRDCDHLTLPANRHDIVFFHGSLHHISDPDLCSTRSTKP